MTFQSLRVEQIDREAEGRLAVSSAPAAEPLSAAEAKAQINLEISDDDTLIASQILGARQKLEKHLDHALITQTLTWKLQRFPVGRRLLLPRPLVQSVTSVQYTDQDGTTSVFSSSSYVVDPGDDTNRGGIYLKDGQSWPSDSLQVGFPVVVTYVAGYGNAGSDVPEPIRLALRLLVGHYYENREESQDSRRAQILRIPEGVQSLVEAYRVHA